MEWIVALIVGIIVGGLACWLIQEQRAKARVAVVEARIDAAGDAKQQMGDAFKAMASDALQANNRQFLTAANENLGKTLAEARGEFEKRHTQFQELVKPLSENYVKLNPTIELLMNQNRDIVRETGKLSSALRDNRQAGHWGEIQLRRIVELAEMVDYCDFAEQKVVDSGERPDLVVRLPENSVIVVDAKASIAAYLEAHEAQTEDARDAAMQRHAGALKRQVDELNRKRYGATTRNSLDFVVMFVPGDQFLAAALSANPNLVEYAMDKHVAIATPASLISLLWTVQHGWQRHNFSENAEKVRQAAQELYKRIEVFMGHYWRVGERLESAVKTYNQSIGSYERQVAPQGRRFAQLASVDAEPFATRDPVEVAIRETRGVPAIKDAVDGDDDDAPDDDADDAREG